VDRLIMRTLPVQIRTSHGDELEDMLACSTRPVSDRADVVIAGMGLRLGRAIRPLLVAALIGICASALGVVRVIGDLERGVIEVPDHWWSMFAAACLVGSLFAATVLGLAQRSAAAWDR
jgi:hypothetical protein